MSYLPKSLILVQKVRPQFGPGEKLEAKPLFETDPALQNAEREIAELKEQLREAREESFRRLNRIAALELALQKKAIPANQPAGIDAETKEKMMHHIRQIQAILDSI